MCEYWEFSCGHAVKTPCKLPKLENQPMRNKLATVPENSAALVQYDLNRAQQRPGESKLLGPSRCCPGFPDEPRKTNDKCFNCLSQDEGVRMQSMRPQVERLRIKREGAGNDNWGFSSQGMVGFGEGGNSSWLDQYDKQNGGFGTYLGGGRVMPDKRQPRQMAPQGITQGMRVMPPGGPQTWPYGPGGTLSNNTSSAGGNSNKSSHVGWGSSASANVDRSNSDASTGSSSNGSFMNPWANAKSDMGHVGVPGGKLPQGYGNGNFMPHMQRQRQPRPGGYALPPQPETGETRMTENGFQERDMPRDRYSSF